MYAVLGVPILKGKHFVCLAYEGVSLLECKMPRPFVSHPCYISTVRVHIDSQIVEEVQNS